MNGADVFKKILSKEKLLLERGHILKRVKSLLHSL